MRTLVDQLLIGTKFRTFATTLIARLLIACCAIAVLLYFASIFGAMIFMGWGAVIPAQVQITLDRKDTPHDEVLKAIASSAQRQGYSLNLRGEKETPSFGFFFDKAKRVHVDISSPSATVEPMFSVVDRENANQSIYVAKAIGDDLSRSFPIKKIYVQLDPKQYDCVKSGCTFEMSPPIDVGKLPLWLGAK